ncbi:MAG: ABC transporter ATP-binding protein [Lachnospiraceae bacterium]|nr:ABC transporter ATP-binding protein [Lachnospiraceae bacterium]
MTLEIKGLGRVFVQGDKKNWAVQDVNLSIPQGKFISVIGRSGSGKSTLLNLIAGLLEPTVGDIFLNGRSIHGLSDRQASGIRNREIGYIMQGRSVLNNLTVFDNVRLPFYFSGREGDVTERTRTLLEQVGLSRYEQVYPAKLSGGELRRVAIARALVNQPGVLLADEPTSNLDGENTEEIMYLFRQIADRGTTVLMVTHELDTLQYGDEVYRMEAGRLTV